VASTSHRSLRPGDQVVSGIEGNADPVSMALMAPHWLLQPLLN
jgi:hypothetical protein